MVTPIVDSVDAALITLDERGWFDFRLTAVGTRWKFSASRLDSTIGASDLPRADLALFALSGVDYDGDTSTATIQTVSFSPRLTIINTADKVLRVEAAAAMADAHAKTVGHLNEIVGRYGFGDATLDGDDTTGWTLTYRRPLVYTGTDGMAAAGLTRSPDEDRLADLGGLPEVTVEHDDTGATCHVEITAPTLPALVRRAIQVARLAGEEVDR